MPIFLVLSLNLVDLQHKFERFAAPSPGWLHQKQRTGEVVLGSGPQPEPRREEEFTPAWSRAHEICAELAL